MSALVNAIRSCFPECFSFGLLTTDNYHHTPRNSIYGSFVYIIKAETCKSDLPDMSSLDMCLKPIPRIVQFGLRNGIQYNTICLFSNLGLLPMIHIYIYMISPHE